MAEELSKKSSVPVKKSTVTVSTCKIVKGLIVTVDFLQVLTIHLPHYVKCITIPINGRNLEYLKSIGGF